MSGLGGKVAIIGTGTIKFGENFHQSLSDMIFEAVNLAMADAKIESRQLEAAWFGWTGRKPPGVSTSYGREPAKTLATSSAALSIASHISRSFAVC